MKLKIILLIALFIQLALSKQEYALRKLGQFKVDNPAHMRLIRVPGRTSNYSLFMTYFNGNPFFSANIREVPNIAQQITSSTTISRISPRNIVQRYKLSWSNEVKRIPHEVFGTDYLYNADGFLVPFKDNGDLYIIKINNNTRGGYSYSQPQPISQRKDRFFYHNALWIDVNGDGRIDVITARASLRNGRDNAEGELLWLEHPEKNAETTRWKEHVLAEGPDVSVKLYDFLKVKGQIQIVACEFWGQQVTIRNLELGKNGNPPKILWKKVVANDIGFPYEVRFGDLNADGKDELLVTNHEDVAEESALFAFEVPSDVRNGVFKKHVLKRGFVTRQPGDFEASPGFPFIFYPEEGMKGRPHIMVAGDGTQQAYYFYPIGETGFEYGGGAFIRVTGVVGDIAYADLDGDGLMEVFVPNYHNHEMHVLKFYKIDKNDPKDVNALVNALELQKL